MRCPDCNKFVGYDEPQVELQDESIDDDGNVSANVHMTLCCAECGGDLKDYDFELEETVEHECKKKEGEEEKEEEGDEGFTLEMEDPEAYDDYQPKTNKKGKPVPMRYQKHMYGVTVNGTVTCNKCGEKIVVELKGEEQASSFNELV